MKRILFGCILIFCGFIGTLSTWVLQHVCTISGNGRASVVLTESEAAVPFVLSLIFLISGLCLCIFELVRDQKQKKP